MSLLFERRTFRSLLLAGLLGLCGCQILGKYDTFEPPPPHKCDVLPRSKPDGNEGTLVVSKPPNTTCYWIDETEVTVKQYRAFLAAHEQGEPVAWDPKYCAWKQKPSDPVHETIDSCESEAESDPFADQKPIRCVDWCDARAFCNWAGKDLCRGLTNSLGITDPRSGPDEWGRACSTRALTLPYGDGQTFKNGVCNVGLSVSECSRKYGQPSCGAVDVRSDEFPECKGPSGTIGMVGNVAEWVFTCGSSSVADGGVDTPQGKECQHRGGSFKSELEDGTCYGAAIKSSSVNSRNARIGLRCCAGLTRDELTRIGEAN
jgi:formylglycine-generating enzyme